MANVRINVFENFSNLNRVSFGGLKGSHQLHIHGVYIPGSLSFNNVVFIKSQNNSSNTHTISFGLYSLTGATLSLANSASQSNTQSNGTFWITLVTSATQDITPGNWYLAAITALSSVQGLLLGNEFISMTQSTYGRPFVRGYYSVTTTAFPVSIATSDLSKEGSTTTANDFAQPYILISS